MVLHVGSTEGTTIQQESTSNGHNSSIRTEGVNDNSRYNSSSRNNNSSSVDTTLAMPGSNSNTMVASATSGSEPESGGGNRAPSVVKKKGGLSLGNLKSPFKFIGSKTYCKGCKKKCSGEVLRVNDVYFHPGCFKCRSCQASLSQGGFFTKEKDYYCSQCYQINYGTKCAKCDLYVEGEVVSALGKTYHQNCFTCASCGKPFPTGERVTFTGKTCLCQRCIHANGELGAPKQQASSNQGRGGGSSTNGSPQHHNGAAGAVPATEAKSHQSQASPQQATQLLQHTSSSSTSNGRNGGSHSQGISDDSCAGCGEELKDGQALMALDKQYHVWCFKCRACQVLLHGEYMGKDGHPYCEKDYQHKFGVKCTYCRRFISGKVLQAGDNNHFHPTCARCTKCGEPFGDGEEMFLQGAAIWHPRCGPGPDEGGFVINGYDNGNVASYHQSPGTPGPPVDDGASMASAPFYGSRASSPGASLRRGDPYYNSGRFSRSTTQIPGWTYAGSGASGNGLYSSSSTYSLRRPIEPGDRSGSSANMNHFHLPPSRRSSTSRYMPPPSRTSVENLNGGSAAHRPISCPPKPGYTHSARSSTLPSTPGASGGHYGTAISPGPGMHFNDFTSAGGVPRDDAISQQSFRTDYTLDNMRPSNTFSHSLSRSYHSGAVSGRHTPAQPFMGEHKIYPLHMLFTSNYKLPPDLDRCNLEKHLSDTEFQMAFHMNKEEFYNLPHWRRNDMKRRMKLF